MRESKIKHLIYEIIYDLVKSTHNFNFFLFKLLSGIESLNGKLVSLISNILISM